jgi:hypothetical protein
LGNKTTTVLKRGGNVRLLQPIGKLFLKCEIDRGGLNGLCASSLNVSQENDEKQTQWYLLCGYAVHGGVKTFSIAQALTKLFSAFLCGSAVNKYVRKQ